MNKQIGARACMSNIEDKQSSILEIFIFLLEFITATFLFMFILPIFIIFIIYKMGFKNTIKFLKRCDREYKRKNKM